MWRIWPISLAGSALVAALLPIVSIIAICTAVQQRIVTPPRLDFRLGDVRLATYATANLACAPYTICPPESGTETAQEYFVFWVIDDRVLTNRPYGGIARRLLAVPLRS